MTENKFHKDRFDVISDEKKKQIKEAAMTEFAMNGFNGTNINKVAKRAKISIGAMYSYFENKDDLFLTIVGEMLGTLEQALGEVDPEEDVLIVIEKLFYKAHDYAVVYPQMNQIYLDFSTQSLNMLSKRISKDVESLSKALYKKAFERALEKGLLDENIDIDTLCFLIDNLMITYQFSYTSDYYKDRMKIFLGKSYENHHKQIEAIMYMIKKIITPN